ncbi:MAG: ArsR family transcriptional regulator, partial [Anaerolineales bacterium]
MNIKSNSPEKKISRLLDVIGKPARLQILLAIGSGEACVCHLESVLGMRQAYISQHLMSMRKSRVLSA